MEFLFNENKKNEIVKHILKKNKYLRKTYFASKLFFVLSYASLLFYFCFYVLPLQLNFEIFLNSTILFIILFFLALIARSSVMSFVSPDLAERTNERLTQQSNVLIYSFSKKYETNIDDRYRVYIPIEKIEKITFDEETKRIILMGEFSQKYAKNCNSTTMPPHRGRITNEKDISKFVIYDYFEPSLYDFLKSTNDNVGNNYIDNPPKCSP